MRFGTHLKAARTTRLMTPAATSLLSHVGENSLSDLEANQRLPSRDELVALCRTYTLDTPTAFLWICEELVELVVANDGENGSDLDEDLLELADRMAVFLAQRGRL